MGGQDYCNFALIDSYNRSRSAAIADRIRKSKSSVPFKSEKENVRTIAGITYHTILEDNNFIKWQDGTFNLLQLSLFI